MDLNLEELKTTQSGDFELLSDQDSLLQDENIIIISDKGKIYNNILMGVGITKYLNGPTGILAIKSSIKREFEKDNIIVNSVQVLNGELYIDSYKKNY